MPEFASICFSKREFFVDPRDRNQKKAGRKNPPFGIYLFVLCGLVATPCGPPVLTPWGRQRGLDSSSWLAPCP